MGEGMGEGTAALEEELAGTGAATETALASGDGAAPEEGAASAAPRTYSEKEVSEIVSKRLKEDQWKEFGKPDEVRAALKERELLRQRFESLQSQFTGGTIPGGKAPEQLSPEDQKFMAYLEQRIPGVTKLPQTIQGITQMMQALDQSRWNMTTERNEAHLREVAVKAGYAADKSAQISDLVANSIRGNKEDFETYLKTGNAEIVDKHFGLVDAAIKGLAPSAATANPAAATLRRVANLAPKMPVGGGSPAAPARKKLTDEERVAAAHERLIKG